MKVLLMIAVCILYQILLVNGNSPKVNIPDGVIEGVVMNDYNGAKFYGFKGIPYAKPPLGEYRFRAAVENDAWKNVLNATMYSPPCSQPNDDNEEIGSEDCLYLNVFTPSFQYTLLKPVLVFIHGGDFTQGNAHKYGGEYIMREDIVLVTIQYRLGIYGSMHFLEKKYSHNDNEFVANNALKDQVLALKWVQKNIKYFGGNPKQVTLCGHSAGGSSTHAHVLSPLSKGLFHRAILMSASAISTWAYGTPNTAIAMATYLNISTSNEDLMINQLKNVSNKTLFAAANKLKWFDSRINILPIIGIVNENQKPNSFMPTYPLSIIQTGQYTRMPMLMGNTNQESLLMYEKIMQSTLDSAVPFFFKHSKDALEEIKNFYKIDATSDLNIISMYSDDVFRFNEFRAALEHKKIDKKSKIYYYEFSGDTALNTMKSTLYPVAKYKGACHGDDLRYLFHIQGLPFATKRSVEEKIMKIETEIFANFIKYGKPLRKWSSFKTNKYNIANITNNGVMFGVLDKKPFQFWLQMYEKYSNGVY